mmetsp:Transcript_113318/g.325782  ORF Transcript_113318/g.325782 Transcript_113318/m.325782 type:complete len:400 (-) Transcript_113318:328-1527(-)
MLGDLHGGLDLLGGLGGLLANGAELDQRTVRARLCERLGGGHEFLHLVLASLHRRERGPDVAGILFLEGGRCDIVEFFRRLVQALGVGLEQVRGRLGCFRGGQLRVGPLLLDGGPGLGDDRLDGLVGLLCLGQRLLRVGSLAAQEDLVCGLVFAEGRLGGGHAARTELEVLVEVKALALPHQRLLEVLGLRVHRCRSVLERGELVLHDAGGHLVLALHERQRGADARLRRFQGLLRGGDVSLEHLLAGDTGGELEGLLQQDLGRVNLLRQLRHRLLRHGLLLQEGLGVLQRVEFHLRRGEFLQHLLAFLPDLSGGVGVAHQRLRLLLHFQPNRVELVLRQLARGLDLRHDLLRLQGVRVVWGVLQEGAGGGGRRLDGLVGHVRLALQQGELLGEVRRGG